MSLPTQSRSHGAITHAKPLLPLFLVAYVRNLAALHPDYVPSLRVSVDDTVVVEHWQTDLLLEGDMQEIPGLEGITGAYLRLEGIMEPEEYLGILEVSLPTCVHRG